MNKASKIFSVEQIRRADQYTIDNEPIASIDLMERAGVALFNWIFENFKEDRNYWIFCGTGNNGGDGLVVARKMNDLGWNCRAYIVQIKSKGSEDFEINKKRLLDSGCPVEIIQNKKDLPKDKGDILIDAVFGSGISGTLRGLGLEYVNWINDQHGTVISIDMPSGLAGDVESIDGRDLVAVKADYTATIQFPKQTMLFEEFHQFCGPWDVVDIQLSAKFIAIEPSNQFYLKVEDIRPLLRPRRKYDHKGSFGHVLTLSGSATKTGAAVLMSKAALRAGAGLVTSHLPSSSSTAINIAAPEVMTSKDINTDILSELPDLAPFNAIGCGPGIGTKDETVEMLRSLLESAKCPIVLDADALNMLAEHTELQKMIPKNSILTPHPGEWARIMGRKSSSWIRVQEALTFAKDHQVIVLMKGAHSAICLPDGRTFFNSTGNPGMGTAGSGDVLTGILTSLLAQGYTPEHSALIGAYLYGLAGDLATKCIEEESLIATDIIEFISDAYAFLKG